MAYFMSSEATSAIALSPEKVAVQAKKVALVTERVAVHAEKIALQAEVLTTLDSFIDLRQEWEVLIDEAQIPHPFLSHVWLRSWWESFGTESGELRIIVIREDGHLVAAAPLVLRRTRLFGIPVRTLESIYNAHTPRFEFPLCTEHQAEVYALLWKTMAGISCDAIILKQFPEGTGALKSLQNSADAAGWFSGKAQGARQPYIVFDEDPQSLLRQVKSKQRYNLRSRLKSLSRLGEVQLEQITEPAQIEAALRDGLELEAAAWKGEAGTAIASDPHVESFYSQLAYGMAELGCLRLLFLKLDGRRIAFDYIIGDGKTAFGIKIGYDPQYRTYAPGHTLTWLGLQDACERGYTEYDFLGDDDPWKLAWTRDIRLHTWLFLFRPGARGWLLNTLKFRLVPLSKQLRARLPVRRASR
jgi:CelD/BcsL family acetyltransferase involved in cellulose biosynthesis